MKKIKAGWFRQQLDPGCQPHMVFGRFRRLSLSPSFGHGAVLTDGSIHQQRARVNKYSDMYNVRFKINTN